jgi:hypothetical protein
MGSDRYPQNPAYFVCEYLRLIVATSEAPLPMERDGYDDLRLKCGELSPIAFRPQSSECVGEQLPGELFHPQDGLPQTRIVRTQPVGAGEHKRFPNTTWAAVRGIGVQAQRRATSWAVRERIGQKRLNAFRADSSNRCRLKSPIANEAKGREDEEIDSLQQLADRVEHARILVISPATERTCSRNSKHQRALTFASFANFRGAGVSISAPNSTA